MTIGTSDGQAYDSPVAFTMAQIGIPVTLDKPQNMPLNDTEKPAGAFNSVEDIRAPRYRHDSHTQYIDQLLQRTPTQSGMPSKEEQDFNNLTLGAYREQGLDMLKSKMLHLDQVLPFEKFDDTPTRQQELRDLENRGGWGFDAYKRMESQMQNKEMRPNPNYHEGPHQTYNGGDI